MSCNKNCPHIGKTSRVPRHRLDAARRKLEFSDQVSETGSPPPPPANKYEHFKKVSESHSSHTMEPPMYSRADMASVPESFLEAFGGQRDVAAATVSQKKAPAITVYPPCEENADVEMPGSFLEFCQAKIAARPTPAKSPPRRPIAEGSFYVQAPTPYNTSYYGYEDPAAQHGIIFNPKITSTPCTPKKATPKTPHPGYYYPPPFTYYTRPPSCDIESPYPPIRAGAVGLGKYAYAASHSPATPPTPASACGGACAKSGTYGDSTVSSGDLLSSSPRKGRSLRQSHTTEISMVSGRGSHHAHSPHVDYGAASYRYPTPPEGAVGLGKYAYAASHSSATPPTPPSACTGLCADNGTLDESAVGAPLAQSTPINAQFKYEMSSVRREVSSSSIPDTRRRQSDTVCTDDMLESGKSSARCPTLGVTPVHSAASLSSSRGNLAYGNRQNMSKSIENELRAREAQERNQLECDLTRWQQARRRLVMNTANMGA